MITLIAATTSIATSSSFTTTGPFVLYGMNFSDTEHAILEQDMGSGTWRKVTSADGFVGVSEYPNSILWDAAGTFRVAKGTTKVAASVYYEEQ